MPDTLPDRPTDDDLALWRRLADAATPGPWFDNSYSLIASAPLTEALGGDVADYPDRYDRRPTADSTDEEKAEITREYWAWHREQQAAYDADPTVAWVPALVGDTATGRHAADREFIAAARTAVSTLLAEVERLRFDRDAWKATADTHLTSEADAHRDYANRIIDAMGHDPNRYDDDSFPDSVEIAVSWQAEQLAALQPVARAAVALGTARQPERINDGLTHLRRLVASLPDDVRAELEATNVDADRSG